MKRYLFCIVSVFISAFSVFTYASNTNNLEKDIDWLIEQVRISGYVFIRNGDEHSSEEAAQHIRKKYEYYKDKIRTVQDFIDYAASKSAITGRPYLVKDRQGKINKTGEWLMKKYKERQRKSCQR